ncbi:LytR C-terminal domain-containing protein [Myceligenerans xiligouense]|uniref:LytR cell envelope-related transcriptional attenuator n=1 Tax=Myceligenerans xiligouense TaxID=253184 RepID=A0A3N4YJU9_9MICO|nr:LytR C-terminal domain-containing protein [Myceligenerans xiligouense]RPF19686.1 LytR cell envelope-related transcriptional attenuator [Myceligenerans xiligouense]
MTDPSYDEARVARRRRQHERQAVVFGVIIAFLAVAGIFALAMYTGSLVGPFQREFTVVGVSQQEEVPAPCLPEVEGQPDGALPLPYADVEVNSLNASDNQGVAKAFEDVLVSRGFTVLELGTMPEGGRLEVSELRFGTKGIVHAYTLAAQFPSIRMVMDDRNGARVDLLIGDEYDTPVDIEDVPPVDEPLENVDGCVPADEITPKERALSLEMQAAEGNAAEG